jgi:hypothetical protein
MTAPLASTCLHGEGEATIRPLVYSQDVTSLSQYENSMSPNTPLLALHTTAHTDQPRTTIGIIIASAGLWSDITFSAACLCMNHQLHRPRHTSPILPPCDVMRFQCSAEPDTLAPLTTKQHHPEPGKDTSIQPGRQQMQTASPPHQLHNTPHPLHTPLTLPLHLTPQAPPSGVWERSTAASMQTGTECLHTSRLSLAELCPPQQLPRTQAATL